LLEQMANGAGGLAAFVSTEDSFARQAKLMRQKLLRPAIEDVTVDFGAGHVRDVEPTELGDLFYGMPLRLYGRFGSAGPVMVTVSGQIQGSPWKQSVELPFPDSDQGNSEIERMWAQARVRRLLAEERPSGRDHHAEIVRLCEGYSIVSRYASMLVLENDAEYRRWKIQQRNAVRIARDRKARAALQAELAQLQQRARDRFEVERASRLVSTAENPSADRVAPSSEAAPRQTRSAAPSPPNRPSTNPRNGADLNVGVGGGAIDPLTALVSIGAAGAAAWSRRRNRRAAA
jgi:hypothetical protein